MQYYPHIHVHTIYYRCEITWLMVGDGGVSYEDDDDDEAVHQEPNAASEEVNATQRLLLIVLLFLLHLSDYCSYRILSVNQNNHYYCNI